MGNFNMKTFVIAIGAALFLTGCASSAITQQERQIILQRCPILKKYTPEQLKAAASELKSLPTESQLARMLSDYSSLREACRKVTEKLNRSRPQNAKVQ
jgi:hypothetical protein